MITLTFFVCISLLDCKEVAQPMDDGVMCPMGPTAQIIAQHWLDRHPKWNLIPGWRCRYGRPERET